MSNVDWKKFIKNSELFGSLTRTEVNRLLDPSASEEKRFAAGEEIIRQDEMGRSFYIIGSGSVAVTRPAPGGGEISLAVLGSGDFFGELALLSQQSRSATVRAREECIVLRINADNLKALIAQHPEVLAGIFMTLSERLRDLANRVVDVSYHEVNNKLELFSTKLDAELKAMNTTLAATQSFSEQTTKRANEVIADTAKYWKRLTMAASLALGVLAVFGITTYRDFTGHMETAIRSIDSNVDNTRKAADESTQLTLQLREQYLVLNSAANYSVVPILKTLNDHQTNSAQYYLPILKNNLKLLLGTEDENSTTIVLKELYDWMTTSLVNANEARRIRDLQRQVNFIFAGIIDSPNTQSRNGLWLRNKAISYYFLLANLAMEDNVSEYDLRLNQLNKLLRDKKSWIILPADVRYFEPRGFSYAADEVVNVLKLSPEKADQMKRRITAAWEEIAKP